MPTLPIAHAPTAPRRLDFKGMHSAAGAVGALAVLLAVPMAILSQIVGISDGFVVHLFLGVGTLLVGWAALQLGLPRWLAWAGYGVATGLAAIFAIQALTELTMNASLRSVAYGVLGQWPEGVLGILLVAWFFALLLLASRGWTRRLGWIVLPAVAVSTLLRWLPGVTLADAIPGVLPLLVACGWFLFESIQPRREQV